MDELTKSKVQMFGAWCGIGYLVTIFGGFGLVAGWLPPTPPTDSVAEIAAMYDSDYMRIRIGMLLVMLSALVFLPFAATMAQYISRIERGAGILTYTFLLGAAGNMVLSFYPAIWWLTAAYRPDRDPNLLLLMNDMSWLQFLGGITILSRHAAVAHGRRVVRQEAAIRPSRAGSATPTCGSRSPSSRIS